MKIKEYEAVEIVYDATRSFLRLKKLPGGKDPRLDDRDDLESWDCLPIRFGNALVAMWRQIHDNNLSFEDVWEKAEVTKLKDKDRIPTAILIGLGVALYPFVDHPFLNMKPIDLNKIDPVLRDAIKAMRK